MEANPRTRIGNIPVYCRFDEIVPIADIKPNPRNPNRHPEQQIKMLAHIIETQGWRAPITVSRRSGYIVKGHARKEAGSTVGDSAPVEYQEYESDAAELADLVADNRIAELAVLDEEQITELLAEMAQECSGIDVELAGYTVEHVKELIEKHMDSGDAARQQAALTLQQRFIVSPFSVLDARAGIWAERKKAWRNLGIKSEIGRGNDDNKTDGGLTFARSSQPPSTYEAKNAYEQKIGKKISWEEFSYLFPNEMVQNGTSMFDPVLCEVAYRWFCPQGGSIIDPFAGGSVRGIVAALTGRHYTGIDLSARQIDANRVNWKEIVDKTVLSEDVEAQQKAPDPRWIVGDGMKCAELAPGEYDLVFTCPPYADLEVYSDDEADISNKEYPEFLRLYREIVARACAMLKPNRFACVVVGDVRDPAGNYRNFVGDTVQAFVDAGMKYYNEAILIMAYGSLPIRVGKQFKNSRKVGKAHQNVLMFHNGDPEESGLFDYSAPELAEADVQKYLAQTKGRLGKAHGNVLVFSNGDPEEAAAAIGTVETEEDLMDIDNAELLNSLLGGNQEA